MFTPGLVYQRDQLHREWSGDRRAQPQGGILTPKDKPFILLITGSKGHQYGYADKWKGDTFHYFGAGREGPMKWLRGNAAIRHDGKDLHLFEEVPEGLRYWGQLDYAGYRYQDGVPDKKGDPRRAIVFLLTPHDQTAVAPPKPKGRRQRGADSRWKMDKAKLRSRARLGRGPVKTAAATPRAVYERSQDLRVYILRRADGRCEGCGAEGPFETRSLPHRPYLEPHHTERLSDGGPDHPAHVIALCPSCHRRVHHGKDGQAYNRELKVKLRKLER